MTFEMIGTMCIPRFSLPVNFQAVVLKPHRKQQKKLAETLNQMFGHLDSKFIASEIDVSI